MTRPKSAPREVGLRQRLPSATGFRGPVKPVGNSAENTLVVWDDLPAWRRDNAFIYSGYRRNCPSYLQSLRSLFYLHNQFFNIWSHLVGAIVAIAGSLYLYFVINPRYESATPSDLFVFAFFFGGAVLCLGMSATFHTVLDQSPEVARWGNKLDYTGIVALIVGSNVPALYYGFFCKPTLLMGYWCLICFLGTGCAIVSWVEQFRTPGWRRYRVVVFIGLGLSGCIPVVHGITIYGYSGLEDRMSVTLTIIQGAMYIVGAILYATRWPERSFPGRCDIWGSSHQIFHMFVLLAAAIHFCGLAKAFDYRHTVLGSHCISA